MTEAQFQAAALEIFQNYWRIKAANALYRAHPPAVVSRLDYKSVPSVGLAHIPSATETMGDAISAMNDFIAHRLRRGLLFSLIAEFETRLSSRLVSLGHSGEGPLGNLQLKIQKQIPVTPAIIQDMDEVRERRNAMIHNADLANQRYVIASAAVQPRAQSHVTAAVFGDNVSPHEPYLAYATDVLVRYSNAIG